MASEVLRTNKAIVLFGAPNSKKVKVSEAVESLGLDLLKTTPSNLEKFALPDINQYRYGDYLQSLPAFMYSHVQKIVTSSHGATFQVEYSDLAEKGIPMLPFSKAPLILAWAGEIPAETLQQMRDTFTVRETVSGGKPAVCYTPKAWAGYDDMKKYKANIRASANINEINIKAMIRLRRTVAVFTSFLSVHKYPAFVDSEHMREVSGALGARQDGNPMEVDGRNVYESKPIAPFGNHDIQVKAAYMLIDASKDATIQTLPAWLDFDVDYSSIPNCDGLWFPYISALSNYDTDTVPEVIERYFLRCLGDSLEDCIKEMREIRGEWGMIGKTDCGKEISHFAACLGLGLQGQFRPVPCFRVGAYVGTILSGGASTVNVAGSAYRPVSYAELTKAVQGSDMHQLALVSIGKLMANEAIRENFDKAATSMLGIRNFMLAVWSKETQKPDILRYAACLTFPDSKPWAINETTITKAFEAITDPNFSLKFAKSAEYPIHYSMIFEPDVLATVWSCFGGMAPTFRIPGGHPFDLREEMIFDQKAKDGKISKRNLVRICVRNVVLPKAVADLRVVLSEKTILNPLTAPKIRVSAQYQDKMFTEERAKALMASLRSFCGIQLDKKGKKRARDDEEGSEPAAKKGKSKDTEGW